MKKKKQKKKTAQKRLPAKNVTENKKLQKEKIAQQEDRQKNTAVEKSKQVLNTDSVKKTGVNILLTLTTSIAGIVIFPNLNLWPLAWIALVPVFFAISRSQPRQAFFLGWLGGWVNAIGVSYWIFHAISFGNAGVFVRTSAVFFVGGYIGLYAAVFSWCTNRLLRSDVSPFFKSMAIPCLWVALEFSRAHLFTGMPWCLFGYSQYSWLQLIQVSDITGVYGISFLLVMANYAIYTACRCLPDLRLSLKRIVPSLILTGAVLVYGSIQLSTFSAPSLNTPSGSKSIAVLQSDVPQDYKWLMENKEKQLLIYLRLTEEALKKGARVIIWPETATQYYLQKSVPEQLISLLDRYNASAVIGGFRYEKQARNLKRYNSAFHIDKTGIINTYNKIHLVPMSEYFPFQFSNFLKLQYTYNQLSAGKEHVVFTLPEGRFGTLICFEIIFPELSRGSVRNGAEFIVNISNDAWFGESNGHRQHFTTGIFRAIECRRPLIRSANTGISGFIDSSGKTIKQLDPFKEDFLLYSPKTSKIQTFYCRYGDLFALLCFLGFIPVFSDFLKRFQNRFSWRLKSGGDLKRSTDRRHHG